MIPNQTEVAYGKSMTTTNLTREVLNAVEKKT